MSPHFREGTNDSLIFDEIFKRNAYRLPENLFADDIIIDIGAHLGFFTEAAVQRGARKIHAVEAERENYRLAKEYLKEYIDQGSVSLRWEQFGDLIAMKRYFIIVDIIGNSIVR